LLRQINIPIEIDFIAVSSYSAEARTRVRPAGKDLEPPINGAT
jgi:hypoxanthine-guanine phosphoribosyltransferase